MTTPIDTTTAAHYVWGDGCDGWHLVRTPALSIIQERMPPDAAETRHRHTAARQFFFVLSGRLQIEVEGIRYELGPREGLEIPPGLAHQVLTGVSDGAEFLVVSQPPSHGDRAPA